ncbi:hypothetical protein PRIPAC_93454 [Pristionchus pacificus]|uniref:Uncharacterized protein n=1 Tax=Pristionchus pacificus TaxID=54126 RepID=A0A2A6CIK3_PRIPA|nr:hypothetical protein PRIPAC_93454 [Pristionchus pacificus]|eukprot:PDM77908.1 hypothetical protein PRIPAC_34775 [Pristionchus pacificus]
MVLGSGRHWADVQGRLEGDVRACSSVVSPRHRGRLPTELAHLLSHQLPKETGDERDELISVRNVRIMPMLCRIISSYAEEYLLYFLLSSEETNRLFDELADKMNIFRKKSTTSQSSFTVLDQSQDSVKPKSACSVGCDPIFEWKDYSTSSTQCDISIPVDEGDLDASSNDDKENQARSFWKRAVAVRQELTDELNESADEISFRSLKASDETLRNQIKWDRFYTNSERARIAKEKARDGEEKEENENEDGDEVVEEEEQEEDEEEDKVEGDDDEEEEYDNSYQRLDESDDQESE